MKKSIIIAVCVFVFGYAVGFIIFKRLDFGLEGLDGGSYTAIESPNFFDLLYTNGSVCLFLILGSGIVTIPLGIYQGLQLGAMLALWLDCGYSVGGYLMLTLPHCIFEIPALILSIALGLKILSLLIKLYRREEVSFRKTIKNLKWYMAAVPSLLIIAAVIESFFTGWVYNIIMMS